VSARVRAPGTVMQLGIRAKLFALSVALIAVGLLGAQWYVSHALERDLRERVQH
jgi:hypothetical protein